MSTVLSDREVRENIGINLRRLLDDRGWAQAVLCRRTGENHVTISRIVNGKQMPGGGILARIAEAMDIATDRLLQEPPKENLVDSQRSA